MVFLAKENHEPMLAMPVKTLVGVWVVVYLTTQSALRLAAGPTPPPPKLLLEGVASVREQIPPSRLRMFHSYQNVFVHNRFESEVWFDRNKRFYTTANSNYGGLEKIHMYFDGKDVGHFSEAHPSVQLRNLDGGTADFFSDPRVLGITTTYSWSLTVRACLRLESTAVQIQLVGQEEVNNKLCWRVRTVMSDHPDVPVDFWIDEKNRFAVYQVEEKLGNKLITTVRSFYEKPDYPWLPSRIETVERTGDGLVRSRREIVILEAEANVPIPGDTFSLAGLLRGKNLSNSFVQVTDVRKGEIIGWWREGRLLNADMTDPLAKRDGRRPTPWSMKQVMVVGAMAVLLLGPLLVKWLRAIKQS